MALALIYSARAEDQIDALYTYIADRSGVTRAASFVKAITDYCDTFATFPNRGTRRSDLRPGLRVIGFRKRVTIAFEVSATAILIVGIFYGGQNFEAGLETGS